MATQLHNLMQADYEAPDDDIDSALQEPSRASVTGKSGKAALVAVLVLSALAGSVALVGHHRVAAAGSAETSLAITDFKTFGDRLSAATAGQTPATIQSIYQMVSQDPSTVTVQTYKDLATYYKNSDASIKSIINQAMTMSLSGQHLSMTSSNTTANSTNTTR